MGQKAALSMHKYLDNQNVMQDIQIPVLTVTTKNINEIKEEINLNVLGIEN